MKELQGSAAGIMASKDDWYLVVWRFSVNPDGLVAEGWHDAKGLVLTGTVDHATLTVNLDLCGPATGLSMAKTPVPAKLYGAWLGNRLSGSWTMVGDARSEGGRFEFWSESRKLSLSAAVKRGGPEARDMTWDQFVEYRDQGVFSLEDESGLWRGGYEDATGEALEDLHLSFVDGLVRGRGRDKDGDFAIHGSYHVHSSSVHWVKHYTHPHRLFEYRGWWKNGRISGTWAKLGDPEYSGPFEIEPHLDPEHTHLWFV